MKLKCQIKPLIASAIQYDGTNYEEIQSFISNHVFQLHDCLLVPTTFKNNLIINIDDFVVKDSLGNLSCCKPEQFYERFEVLSS